MKTNITIHNTNVRNIKFFLAAVLFLSISLSSWGTTIASWGKVSIAASTAITASGGDANNSGVAQFTSTKDFNDGSGTYAYYEGSGYGAYITFSGLTLTGYKHIRISFYSRASDGKAWQLWWSTNGSTWTNCTGANSQAMTTTETQYSMEGIPSTATYLQLRHLGTKGSLYFGTIVIAGDGSGECTPGIAKGIAPGDELIIYDNTDSKELAGAPSEGYCGGTTFSGTPAGAYPFVIENGYSSGTYSFKHGTKYLRMSSNDAVKLEMSTTKDDASSWVIESLTNDGQLKMYNKAHTGYYLRYHKNNVRFTSYSANTSNTRLPYIYHYCPAEFHVTYNANNATTGSVPVDGTGYDPAGTDQATVLGNTGSLAKTGYTFSGWNTNTGGTGTNYTAGDQFYVTEDITLYAKWVANPYTITLNNQSADAGKGGTGSISVTYDASTNLTETPAITVPQKTGYTFGGYYTDEGGIGTQIIAANGNVNASAGGGSTYTNASKQWKYAGNITLYAKWTQTVDLLKNTGSSDGSVTVSYNVAGTASFSAAVKAGWTCTGYWTTSSGGYKVIEADGTLAEYSSNISSYINSDGKWIHTGATELYAQWEANLYTVTFYKNDISATGSMDAQMFEYGTAQNLLTCTFERTGYSFVGWATTSSGDKAYDDGEEVNNLTNTPDGNVDLFALWSINSYTLTVGTPGNVTITAEPDGGSEMEEGDDDYVEYNTTITLAYTGMTSGYFWGGWRVTDGSGNDITEDVMYDENTMFMPALDATVTAVLYTNAKAWCPVITLEPTDGVASPILVTSVGGQSVKAVRTLHLIVTGAPTTSAKVTLSGTDLEFYDGTSKVTNYITCSSYRMDKTITVAYAPTAYVSEAWAEPDITVACLNSDESEAVSITKSNLVNARCLPDNGTSSGNGFVIAAKVGDDWLALPSSMSAGVQDGLPIMVDDDEDPTAATLAPATARYNLYNVYSSIGVNDRFKANGTYAYLAGSENKALKAASDGTNISLGANVTPGIYSGNAANPDLIEWQLSTTDKKNYTLTNNGRSAQLKYYTTNGKFGMYSYGSSVITEFRLLPATFYTNVPATATEWGQHSVILAANPGATANKAKAHIEAGSPTEDQIIAAINGAIGTAKNIKVPVGDIDLADLANNEGKWLYIDWYNGSTSLGTSVVKIPRIIAASRNMYKDGETTKGPWNTEVHVLPGVTLTANTASYSPSGATIKELHIYPGATLNVSTGTLTATTLRLHNGWTRAGDKKYDVARVYIADDAALEKNTASMDYDIYEQSDGKHYYPLAVPFATAVNTIDYVDPTLAAASKYRTHYVIKEYDGANRAINGEDSENNWDSVPAASTLVPGKGYIMTAVAVKGEAIIRIPLTFNNGWTDDGEKATYDAVTKNVIAVTAYGGAAATAHQRHAGWNMLGVPYMSCFATKGKTTPDKSEAFITGKMELTGDPANPYGGYNDAVPYVTVPTHDFSEYLQYDITDDDTKLLPGWSFFVQFAKDGTLTFENTGQTNSSSLPIYAPQRTMDSTLTRIKTGVILSTADGETSDKFGLIISDRYTQDYEVGADLEKMFGNGYTLATYSLSQGTRLAFNALSTAEAAQVIPVGYRAPEAGQYTFAINPRYATEGLLRVELIDYQTGDLTDLLTSTYTFTTSRTQDDTRFAIHVTYTDPNSEMPTGEAPPIETGETLTRKFILNGQLYIQRGTVIYDATGKEVRL